MTQALPAGTPIRRRRALMGLLDADGWAWAAVKAAIWFVVIILMLGYIPDRALYFTVNRTLDLGPPRLVAGQLLPGREQDPAVPGAGRRGRAVGAVPDGSLAARPAHPCGRGASSGRTSSSSAGRTVPPRPRPPTSPS